MYYRRRKGVVQTFHSHLLHRRRHACSSESKAVTTVKLNQCRDLEGSRPASDVQGHLPCNAGQIQSTKSWSPAALCANCIAIARLRGTNVSIYVKDCLDTGWVSTADQWVNCFEQQLPFATGAAYASVVTIGSVALRLSLHFMGVCRRLCAAAVVIPTADSLEQ